MNRTWITWAGLAVVALAAAVLSFASLRSLAIVCGTPEGLAWLLPLNLDAAAVVATLVWLASEAPEPARWFARTLALGTLALSVAGNATEHFLIAFGIRPPWWAVVAVASVPPVVLGAVAHLVALAAAKGLHLAQAPAGMVEPTAVPTAYPTGPDMYPTGPTAQPTGTAVEPTGTADDLVVHHQVSGGDLVAQAVRLVDGGGLAAVPVGLAPAVEPTGTATEQTGPTDDPTDDPTGTAVEQTDPTSGLVDDHQASGGDLVAQAAHLVAAGHAEGRKVGRGTVARTLGITENQARQVLRQVADQRTPVLRAVGGDNR